jgi:S-adenosylmethionine-diacylglycerol 3-amino-3-carboxypropyl transferase
MNVHQKWIMRYANCWEDADLLIKYIADLPGKKLLSVASGGENSLSLLCTDPQEVWVADINPLQLYVFELKMRGIEYLDREIFLRFAGYRNCNSEERVQIYHSIKPYLSADAAKYWDAYMHRLKNGFIYAGRLEKNLRFFAKYIRPLIHNHKTSANLYT